MVRATVWVLGINLGLMEEQPVLLTAESALRPCSHLIYLLLRGSSFGKSALIRSFLWLFSADHCFVTMTSLKDILLKKITSAGW